MSRTRTREEDRMGELAGFKNVLVIRSTGWEHIWPDGLVSGKGDPLADTANRVRFEGALIIDFRHLSIGRQREAMINLPLIDSLLPRGSVLDATGRRDHESGRIVHWLDSAAPDVFARLAEGWGARVTRPDEVPA